MSKAFIVKLLQRNHYERTPIRRRDLHGPRNSSNGNLTIGNLSGEYTFEIFGEWMISAYVVSNVKHGGGGLMVWGCFAVDTVSDLFRIQGLTSMATTAFCSDTPSHLVCT
jgi:hypothetical protein